MGILVLDDRDAAITYSGADWSLAGSDREFASTTSWTATDGATASVNFTGTGIAVYGTIAGGIRVGAPISTYSIDGGTPVEYEADAGLSVQYSVLFFESPTLPLGEHTLAITNAGAADAPFYLDMIAVTPPDEPLVTTVTQTTTQPASTVQGRTITITESAPTASGSSSNAESAGASSSTNAGAIAGGIIGGVALLALLAGAIFFWRRRRNRGDRSSNHWAQPSAGAIVPFPPPKPTNLDSPAMAQRPLPHQPQPSQSYSNSAGYPYPSQGPTTFSPPPPAAPYSPPPAAATYSPPPAATSFSPPMAPAYAPAAPPDLGYHHGADYEAAYSGYTQGDYNQAGYAGGYAPQGADYTNHAGYGAGPVQPQPWNAGAAGGPMASPHLQQPTVLGSDGRVRVNLND